MADGSIVFDIDILDKRARARLKELESAIESSGDTLDDSLGNSAYKFINDWKKAEIAYEQSLAKMEANAKKLQEAINNEIRVDRSKGVDSYQYQDALAAVNALKTEQEILTNDSSRYAVNMDRAGIGMTNVTDKIIASNIESAKAVELEAEQARLITEQTRLEQESTSAKGRARSILEGTKNLIGTATAQTRKWFGSFKQVNSEASRLKRNAKGLGASFVLGTKSLLKLSLAMLGVRGAMTGLRRLTREWYNSNDVGAKQAQANLGAITGGIVNLLAPALTFVTNVMATLFGYINAVAKAFFGVDLLSKKTAKNMDKGAKNAKKMGKEIKGFTASFDEADVASASLADNMDTDGGGGAEINLEPNIKTPDLSKFKEALEKAFKPFLDTLKSIDLEPLKKSLGNLADVGKESLSILGDSFVRVTNNSIAPFIKLMAEDIVPKGLDTVARVLERLNPVVDKLLKEFIEPLINWLLLDFIPKGLETAFALFESIGGILAVVIESFNKFWDSAIGEGIAFLGAELLNAIMEDLKSIFKEVIESVDYFFKKLEEGDPVAQTIAFGIGLIVSALFAWGIAMTLINVATAIFNAISPFGWIVIAVALVIAIILLLYKNWDKIVLFFKETLDNIKTWFADRWQGIQNGFSAMVESIRTWWSGLVDKLIQGVQDFFLKVQGVIDSVIGFFVGMYNYIIEKANQFGTIWDNVMTGLFDGVNKIIENVKGKFRSLIDFLTGFFANAWSNAWGGIVGVFKNIFDGIGNIFKLPLNIMIDGLNGFIRGINKVKIPSWVPIVGGKGINIGTIPRLAKGASLTHQTTATMAEYPNARTNPEIVSPQKIMRETMAEALAEMNGFNGGGNQELTIVTPVILEGKEIARVTNKVNLADLFRNNGGGLAWNP